MNKYHYIIFKGQHSHQDYDLLIEKLPILPAATRNIEFTPIPGVSGSLTFDEESYGDLRLPPIQLIFQDEDVERKAEGIRAWLDGTPGDLILSNAPDKYLKVKTVQLSNFQEPVQGLGIVDVSFICHPFKYYLGNDMITLTEDGTVYNYGSLNSQPQIKVYGSGDITLTINNDNYIIKNLEGYLVIDSESENVYKDTQPMEHKVNGDELPILQVGENNISWIGNITKLEIKANWRCL